MNEFWALVLGSALAVVGGIVGTLFTQWLDNRNEKQKEKKEAYLNILKFCNRLRFVDSRQAQNVTYDYLTEIASKTLLYASDTVCKEYDIIHNIASEMLKAKDNDDNEKIKSLRKTLNTHIDIISSQMKKELGLENKKSKEILSKAIKEKDEEKKKNGN